MQDEVFKELNDFFFFVFFLFFKYIRALWFSMNDQQQIFMIEIFLEFFFNDQKAYIVCKKKNTF